MRINYTKLSTFIVNSVIHDPNIYYFAISLQIQLKKGNDDEKKKKILNKFSKFMTILKNIVQWKIEKRLKKWKIALYAILGLNG